MSIPQFFWSAKQRGKDSKMDTLLQDPEFKVFWKDRCNVWAYGFEELFEKGLQFDVTLQIGDKQLKAHRHILSFYSEYFHHKFDRWPLQKRSGSTIFRLQDNATFMHFCS